MVYKRSVDRIGEDIFDKIISFLLLLLILVVPLFFGLNINSLDIQKFTCLHVLLILILWCWIAKIVFSSQIRLKFQHPLCYIVLIYLIINISATVCSINPCISFFGFYGHHEGLLALISYVIIYWSVLNFIKKDRIIWVLNTVILSCVIAGAYGIIQRLGLDPVQWELFNRGRAPSTFGNPIGFGNYVSFGLLAGFVVYLSYVMRSIKQNDSHNNPTNKKRKKHQPVRQLYNVQKHLYIYGIAIIIMYLGFCMSQTRASYLGLFGGLALICSLYWKVFKYRQVLIITGIILLITLWFNLNPETSIFLRFQKVADELSKVSPDEITTSDIGKPTGPGRFYIWKSVYNIVRDNPLLGTGLDTLGIVYPKYKTIESARTEGAYAIAASAHNELLDIAVSSGILGLISYICLVIFFFVYLIKAYKKYSEYRLYILGIAGCMIAHIIQNQFSPTGTADSCMFWVMIGMINAYHIDTPYIKRLRWLQDGMIKLIVSSIAIGAGIMFLIFMVIRPCIADFNYEQGTLLQAVDGMEEQTIYRFKRAVEFNPHEIQYMREVAAYYIHKAQKNPEEKIIRNAIQASERLIKFNPYDVVGHCIIGAGYYLLGSKLMGKDTELLDKALSSYRKAIQVDPLNPDPHNCKGLVHLELEEYSKAIQEFKQALKVDIGYAIAIGNLHRTYLKLGKFQEAIDTYRNLIKIDPEVRSILLREKLVDIYIRLGRINDAIEECKIIKQFEPENKVAQRILSLYG